MHYALIPALLGAAAFAKPLPRSSSIPVSENTVPFSARIPVTKSRYQVRQNRLDAIHQLAAAQHGKKRPPTGAKLDATTVTLNAPGGADEYALQINLGGQNIQVIADTGSSDLWSPASDFQCLDENQSPVSQSTCDFGPNYFNPNDGSFQKLSFANNFNITYGDGTGISGYGGKDTVTVGGLKVTGSEMGVGERGYWVGDGVTNGLIGLANPAITDIFYGTNGASDGLGNLAEYNPWFYQAVAEGLVDPYFSVVINRPTFQQENSTGTVSDLGGITFGGVPANVPTTGTTVTVPNHLFTLPIDGKNVSQPAYYTLQVDSFNFPGSTSLNTKTPLTILDSGTTLIYVPDAVANAFNKQWSPPAHYSKDEGAFIVDCDAKAPSFSVTIGGKTFTTTAADLIYPSGTQPTKCISSVLRGGSDINEDVFILGDRFLVNVVSTFNIKTNEITVTQRQPYAAI